MTFQLAYDEMLIEVYGQLAPVAGQENGQSEIAVAKYEALQQSRNQFMDSLTLLYPGLYATRIMNAFRAPVVSGSMSHRERIDTLKLRFFDMHPSMIPRCFMPRFIPSGLWIISPFTVWIPFPWSSRRSNLWRRWTRS